MEKSKKETKGAKLKHLFTSNWLSKLASLLLAMAVWFSIFSHLEKTKPVSAPPVPGTIPIPKSSDPAPTPTIPLLSPPPAAIPGN